MRTALIILVIAIAWFRKGYTSTLECYNVDGKMFKWEGQSILGTIGGPLTVFWKNLWVIPRSEVRALED